MAQPLADVVRQYAGRRVLITGAGGFIGRWVARLLQPGGAELLLAARSAASLESLGRAYQFTGRTMVSDLSEAGSFERLYRDARPHITFHLAGYGVNPEERDPQLAYKMNHRLIKDISEIISASRMDDWPGVRLINAGSAAEYGAVPGPVTEKSPENPVNLYARTKLAGKLALDGCIQRTGLRAITARLFTVYGPGEHGHRLLPSLIEAAHTGHTLALTAGEQQRDFTYVADAAEGLVRLGCLEGAAPPVANVATGTLTSVRGFAETAGKVLSLRPGQLNFGALPYRPDETLHGAVNTSLLEGLLGWKPPTSIRSGIEKTVAFRAGMKNECAEVGS
ncbi:MAG: NAD(P)-dependent oxidoreductase [Acidipila sp.]|nr:NAD(P)-dependent oxidoreductase [Acidipila sp.]